MVYFNPIGGAGPVQPIGAGTGNAAGAAKPSALGGTGVDAFTPSFGAAAASSNVSVADIVANVGKLSASDARVQLSKGTQAGLDSFARIHDAF